jgi:hypothetical protein
MEFGRYRERVEERALYHESDMDAEPLTPAALKERSLERLRDRLDRLAQNIGKPAARQSYRYRRAR